MYVQHNNIDMANFVKEKKYVKGAKNRSERLDLRASKEEKELIDELMIVLNKRRHVPLSRMDCIAYCIEAVYHKEDKIRVISKKENQD